MLFDLFWVGTEEDWSSCEKCDWFFALLFIYFNQAISVFINLLKIYHLKMPKNLKHSVQNNDFMVYRTWCNFLEAIFELTSRSMCLQVDRMLDTDITLLSWLLTSSNIISLSIAELLFATIKNSINKVIIFGYDFNFIQRRFIWYGSTSRWATCPFILSYKCRDLCSVIFFKCSFLIIFYGLLGWTIVAQKYKCYKDFLLLYHDDPTNWYAE